jgi:hypothetical protein
MSAFVNAINVLYNFLILTVFDATNVADNNLFDSELNRLTATDHGELMLLVDGPLESTELDFLAPVIERRNSCHNDDGN